MVDEPVKGNGGTRPEPAAVRLGGPAPVVEPPPAGQPAVVCDHCGAAGRIFVREPMARSAAELWCLCASCAEQQRARRFAPSAARPSMAVPVGLAGVVLSVIGIGADWIAPELSAGFGWQQRTALVLGGFAVMLGAILRVDLMVVGGCFLFSAAISADWFGSHASPGLGWKQQLTLLLAALLFLAAVALRERRRLRQAPGETNR